MSRARTVERMSLLFNAWRGENALVDSSTGMTPDSCGPAWGARQSTPAPFTRGRAVQPVSEGLQMLSGQAVRQTGSRMESLPLGALGGVLMVQKRYRRSGRQTRAVLIAAEMATACTFKASPGEGR